jgi:hypothetical protein
MDGTRSVARLVCSILALSAVSSGIGCSMLKPSLTDNQPRAEVTKDGAAPAGPVAKYFVELHPTSGQPTRVERSISGPITAQQALKETDALKKFRRSTIELTRPLANGATHRMTVEYDRTSKQVAPEFDYSLQPGDRLIVKEDQSTVIDDVLDHSLGQYNPKKVGAKGRTKSGGFYRVGD